MTSKAKHLFLPSVLCLLLSFFCKAQYITSKVRSQAPRTTLTIAAQRLKEERAFNDSLYQLMESPPFEHPILQQVERHRTENLALFTNPVQDALVVACAVDKKSHAAFFFTTFGKVSD